MDLTQHGAHNHPTDRIVLCDTAATLALELAADGRARPPTLTRTVILPGSGDTFAITVSAGGTPNYKIERDGRAGDDSAPGAASVIAYARLLGHTPSQDELAGFLAARVAGAAARDGGASARPRWADS